jgi:hypothetical protein
MKQIDYWSDLLHSSDIGEKLEYKLRVPQNAEEFLSSCTIGGLKVKY